MAADALEYNDIHLLVRGALVRFYYTRCICVTCTLALAGSKNSAYLFEPLRGVKA